MSTRTARAFTLIELLIVVAIIALLAAIAGPNFLEAQVRSKVSRTKADMRSMATALEAYRTDYNWYPFDWQRWTLAPPVCPIGLGYSTPPMIDLYPGLTLLTTPVAYITSIPTNPFRRRLAGGNVTGDMTFRWHSEGWLAVCTPWAVAMGGASFSRVWSLVSYGPDMKQSYGEWDVFGDWYYLTNCKRGLTDPPEENNDGALYDATNGSISEGDVVRVGP